MHTSSVASTLLSSHKVHSMSPQCHLKVPSMLPQVQNCVFILPRMAFLLWNIEISPAQGGKWGKMQLWSLPEIFLLIFHCMSRVSYWDELIYKGNQFGLLNIWWKNHLKHFETFKAFLKIEAGRRLGHFARNPQCNRNLGAPLYHLKCAPALGRHSLRCCTL